jgi:hypothetical protein
MIKIWRWTSHWSRSYSTFCVFGFGPLVAKPINRRTILLYVSYSYLELYMYKVSGQSLQWFKTCPAGDDDGRRWLIPHDRIASLQVSQKVVFCRPPQLPSSGPKSFPWTKILAMKYDGPDRCMHAVIMLLFAYLMHFYIQCMSST